MPTSLSKWWGSFREMMIPKRQSRRQLLCDAGITLGILAVAAAVCTLLTHMGDSDSAVPMVFMLAVLLVARLTDGFLFSLVATVVSVIGVNYAFTYPYFAFNFTITGYPLTFVTMFAVSIVVGMLTDQVKRQERVKSEAEKEKMKANLLRSVSHDLRTPLTSIIGSSSAVLENYDQFSDEVKKDLIGHVRDDAQWWKTCCPSRGSTRARCRLTRCRRPRRKSPRRPWANSKSGSTRCRFASACRTNC